jgi:glycosyltransferase involved in cell wall biosynthesis
MRAVQIMNGLGAQFHHTVVALDGDVRAAEGIAGNEVYVDFADCPKTANPLRGIAGLGALMDREKPDLVLTYNWGSIDGVMAARLRRIPVIHTEDGFGHDEATGQKQRRIWFRRAVLRGVRAVVAPSQTLIGIMQRVWKLPGTLIRYIPNGVDVDKFVPALHRANKNGDTLVVGTIGQLRREKRQDLLLEACASLAATRNVRCVFAGDGPEAEALKQRSHDLGMAGRVEFLGRVKETQHVYPQFDIFALSSSTEQMPMSVIEAMACGLPVVSTDVGDVKGMVSDANRDFVIAWPDYGNALERLASDPELRRRLGADNRARCTKVYSLDRMLMAYEELYHSAAGRVQSALQCAS